VGRWDARHHTSRGELDSCLTQGGEGATRLASERGVDEDIPSQQRGGTGGDQAPLDLGGGGVGGGWGGF